MVDDRRGMSFSTRSLPLFPLPSLLWSIAEFQSTFTGVSHQLKGHLSNDGTRFSTMIIQDTTGVRGHDSCRLDDRP